MQEAIIKVTIDDTAKGVKLFEKIESFKLTKMEIFKYAVFMLEVPEHIKDSDFEYLQSKLPALDALYSDFIVLKADAIFNLSMDDRQKKIISEAIGVGIGLKYSSILLDINPNTFIKIETPLDGKYLDYSVIKDGKKYNIETKGTVGKNHNAMKQDIILKKKDSTKRDKVYLEFGTIIKLKSKGGTGISECIVVDDPPNDNIPIIMDTDPYNTKLRAYSIFLSYILDPKYYNKFIKPVISGKNKKVKVDKNKFFGSYEFNGNIYYGEFFDRRLIKKNLEGIVMDANTKNIFKKISDKIGKTKFFIGIDEKILSAINDNNKSFVISYETERIVKNDKFRDIFLDRDGIIFVKSLGGGDKKIEKIFTENEVENRLGLFLNYTKGYASICGAPCRSRELKGKPCEIKTYRGKCHYHR